MPVLNPLESDRPQLATTLLPGLLEALARNVSRGAVDVALFAIEQVVQATPQTRAVDPIPSIAGPPTTRSRPSTTRCRASRCTSASC